MKCCGYERETPFCPMCGNPVSQNTLHQIQAHINNTVEGYQARVRNGRPGPQKEQDERTLDKWITWQVAMVHAMNFSEKLFQCLDLLESHEMADPTSESEKRVMSKLIRECLRGAGMEC